MKTKKEIVQTLVDAYEYQVRQTARCRKWIKESKTAEEEEIFRSAKVSHLNAYLDLAMLLDECEIPYTDSATLESQV